MKRVLWILSVLVIGLSLVTCSKGSDSGERVTIEFMYFGGPDEKASMDASIAEFEKAYPSINVEASHVPQADYDTKMLTMLASGSEPDIAYASEKLARDWYTDGKVLNLYEYYLNDEVVNFDSVIDSVFYDVTKGETIGTNTALETFGIFWNEQVFEKAGVEPLPARPEDALSWDEFVEVAQKLTIDKNGNNALSPDFDRNNVKQWGFSVSSWVWIMFMEAAGGSWLSEDGTKTGLTSKEAIAGIQKMADLVNVYHVMPSPTESKSVMQGGASGTLASGKFAMRLDGNWLNQSLGIAVTEKDNFTYQIGVMPVLNEEVGSITLGIGAPTIIFASTKHPDASWTFLTWLANPETSIDLYKGGLWMPLLKEYYTDPVKADLWTKDTPARPSSYNDAMGINAVENNLGWPSYYVKNFYKQEELVNTVLNAILEGEVSAEDAMKSIESKLNAEVQGYYESSR